MTQARTSVGEGPARCPRERARPLGPANKGARRRALARRGRNVPRPCKSGVRLGLAVENGNSGGIERKRELRGLLCICECTVGSLAQTKSVAAPVAPRHRHENPWPFSSPAEEGDRDSGSGSSSSSSRPPRGSGSRSAPLGAAGRRWPRVHHVQDPRASAWPGEDEGAGLPGPRGPRGPGAPGGPGGRPGPGHGAPLRGELARVLGQPAAPGPVQRGARSSRCRWWWSWWQWQSQQLGHRERRQRGAPPAGQRLLDTQAQADSAGPHVREAPENRGTPAGPGQAADPTRYIIPANLLILRARFWWPSAARAGTAASASDWCDCCPEVIAGCEVGVELLRG